MVLFPSRGGVDGEAGRGSYYATTKALAPIRADLAVLKWMMGVLLAGVLSLVMKTFF